MIAYRLNRLVLIFLMLIYAPGILTLVGLMCWGGYALTRFAFSALSFPGGALLAVIAISVDLMVLVVSFLLLVGLLPLLFKTTVPEVDGIKLLPSEHPNLFALIERFSKRLRTRPPHAVYLTPFDNMSIADLTIISTDGNATKEERTLTIGAALVLHLRTDELGTILCHEIAHAATGDTWFARVTSRFFETMSAAVDLHTEEYERDQTWYDWMIIAALTAYYKLFALLYCTDSRWREYEADRRSAEVCGPKNMATALLKIHLTSYWPQLSVMAMFIEFSENDRPITNLYQEHWDRWQNVTVENTKRARRELLRQQPSVWDTHPVLPRRLKPLKKIEANEWTVDKPATILFGDWPTLEERITHALITWGRRRFNRHIESLDRELWQSRAQI